jgi:serine/threonine-protein kinase
VDSRLGGRYRLIRPLAQGGMAAVWEGYDETLARSVAIKILHPHLAADQQFLERFKHEAVAAARLSHPNVVATYDAGMAGPATAFIVMELVRGETLRHLLDARGPVPPRLAAGIGRQIADALAHAHAAGLIHRDIKPGNVLLDESERSEVPRVKVTDFGIAKAAESLGVDLTRTGVVLGTPRYLSPEQIEGFEPDARADLYALGVVLFEMLAGRPPFSGTTDMATAVQHLNAVPPDVRSLQPAVPAPFSDLVHALLAKRPADRPPSAAVVRQALTAIECGDQPSAIYGPVGWPAGAPTGTPAPATPALGGPAVAGPPNGNGAGSVPTSVPTAGRVTAVLPPPHQPTALRTDRGSTGARTTTPGAVKPFKPRRRPNWPGRVVAGLVAVAVLVAVVVVTGGGSKTHAPAAAHTPPSSPGPLRIATVSVFHLERDADNAAETPNTFDGNPATGWSTDRYFGPNFAGLRHGLGLAITLSGRGKLHQLNVLSPTQGWSAQVYVANGVPVPPTLAAWGKVLDAKQAIPGNASFDLGGVQGSAILLWITDLGPRYQTTVDELQVS